MTCFDIAPDGTVTDYLPEEWEDVPGMENFYQVSNHGRVRSLNRIIRADRHGHADIQTRVGKVLKPRMNHGCVVSICRDGVKKELRVANVVAFIWCDGYQPGFVVGHFDGDQMNCRCDNLFWRRPGRKSGKEWLYVL